MSPLTLHLSDVRLELLGLPASGVETLRAVWGACEEPRRDASRVERWRMERGSRLELLDGDELLSIGHEDLDVPLMVERALYARLAFWHPHATLLHAATVALAGRAVVLLGASGTGKSSLAYAAVRDGFEYLTDELTLTDGRSIWGIPRAIQFDPVTDDEALPPRLAALDRRSYRARFDDGAMRSQPLVPWDQVRVSGGALAADRALLVELLGEGDASIEPLSPIEALAALHRSMRSEATASLGALAGRGRAFQLRWRDPERAALSLRSALEALDG